MPHYACCELIVEYLIRQGIPFVAGIFGHGNLPFSIALRERQDSIRFIGVKHEQSAVHLADGYARATGRPMAVTTSVGPGAFNTLMGIATAYIDSIPMLVFTGDSQTYMWGRGSFQALERGSSGDFPSVTRPITKATFQVTRIEQLPVVLQTAYRVATSSRQGPVHIDLPMDIQGQMIDAEVPDPVTYTVHSRPRGDRAQVARAADLLLRAQRPVIVAGGGVIASGAHQELVALAEYLGIPVLTSFSGKGAIPEDHPLCAFYTGFKGSPPGVAMATKADVLLALGYRFAEWATSSYAPGVAFNIPPTKLIQVDVDESVLARNYPVEVGILGDVKVVLEGLLAEVKSRSGPRAYQETAYFRELQALKAEWQAILEDIAGQAHPMRTGRLLREVRRWLPRDGIIVGAAGMSQMQIYHEFPIYAPRTYISSAGFAPMGFAISAAMGAKLAFPHRTVVALGGDGDFLMNMQELATAVQYNIPIIYVIDNNFGWLSIRDFQASHFDGRFFATEFVSEVTGQPYNPDFVRVAQAFCAYAERVEWPEDIGPALERAAASGRPAVIDVLTNPKREEAGSPTFGWIDVPVPREASRTAPWLAKAG